MPTRGLRLQYDCDQCTCICPFLPSELHCPRDRGAPSEYLPLPGTVSMCHALFPGDYQGMYTVSRDELIIATEVACATDLGYSYDHLWML